MKKFMKAIAFVTVMCMALSTVAFAAGSVPTTTNDKTFKVTVTEAGTDQVALLVVEAGAGKTGEPLYIDQQPAVDGKVEFTAKIAKDVAAVDVYVGYAGFAAEHKDAFEVGNVKLVKPITAVNIKKVGTEFASADGKQQIGAGAAIKFNIEAPADVYAKKMIWAIRYKDENDVEQVKYTDAMDVSRYGIGTLMTGSVELGLAFLNGFTVKGKEIIKEYEITDVDVIFMFSDDEEILTNTEGDSGNKKNN